ncbi:hypothetical protein [Chelativorans sp. J32]|uniref:hypothetical protein n=1 Tax=Chelativorans sp. J32 TaxID=935840 RepID=UPI0004AF87BC|nr:hypothetical protein [Chelativorans sp. J32]
MPFRASLTAYMRRRAALWRRRRTERFISNLPAEIQKDIGWPSSGIPVRMTHHGSSPDLEPHSYR